MTTSRFVRDKFQSSLRLFMLALICAFVMVQLAFPKRPSAAAFNTITVNSLLDDAPNSGNCTLREAIEAANTNAVVDACTAGSSGLDMIVFNVGSGVPSITPTSPLPVITESLTINGNTGGADRVEINGTNAGANVSGLTINASGSQLQSLVINRFSLNGIVTQNSSSNSIKNCIIGLNASANARQANGGHGITINNGSFNVVGGAVSADGNIISGNSLSGIEIVGDTDSNQIFNNIIGTNSAGATGLGNSQNGVLLQSSANIIGSATAGNIISGNGSAGILVLSGGFTTIGGNIIGANSAGTLAIPNNAGIRLESSQNNQIGGAQPGEGNLISGNTTAGIELVMGADNNSIRGNLIGTQLNGTSPLGNGSHGISFPSDISINNTIGGAATLANTIAFNGGAGVSLFAGGTGNRITQNSIFSNAQLGIDLGAIGITANDDTDPDTGPNGLQNFPVITSITPTTIFGSLNSLPFQDFRVEFFANATCDTTGNGEGQVFLGADNPSTDGSGNANFSFAYTPVVGKPFITAVTINPSTGDTSEFSTCFSTCPAIALMPAMLPNATTGSNYSQSITASSGSSPYSFAVTGGTLPLGITLTTAGLLSGMPTQAGVFNFTVTATDLGGCPGQLNYSLIVTCPQIPASITAPATVLAGQNLSYDLDVANPCPNITLDMTFMATTPANTTFVSISNVPGWTCTTPAVGATGNISCSTNSGGPVPRNPNSPKAVFTIVLNVNNGTAPGTVIPHVANIVGTFPGLPSNNAMANGSTTVTGVVGAGTDLSVSTTGVPPAIAGANTTFNITVTNNTAATAATAVTLTGATPNNTTFQSLTSPAGWTCATPSVGGTGAITCNIATLATGLANFALTVRLNPNVACDTTISNTASVISSTTDPVPGNNSSTSSLLSKTQSDLAVNVSAPANAVPDVSATYTVTVSNAGPSASINTMTSNSLPAAFSTEVINTSVGTCTGVGTNSVNCNLGTLAVGATATITIQVHVPETCQPTTAVNTATVTTGNCLADPVAANNSQTKTSTVQIGNLGPGACIPSNQALSTQKPGSVLFGGVFASGASGGPGGDPGNNTAVSLTNVHPKLGVVVHLFFVDGATCSVADAFVCLTPNQTTRFLMSDLDPGVAGYMMAMAVDGPPGTAGGHNSGCPISFNYLIGSARIKMTNSPRREAELASESCASEFGSPLPGCDPNNPIAEIPFDGSPRGFNKLPLVLGVSNIPSKADGNDTMLLLARVDGNWGTGLKPLGNIFGILYDDAENAYSFSFNVGTCLLRSVISNNFPRTAPRLEQVIPAGRSGWMKLWSADNAAIIGAIINRNDNTNSASNAFDGGHTLHVLRLNERVVVTVPVFPPSC